MIVEVHNGDVGKAIRTLKKKVFMEGILLEVRRREAYEKPSVKRRRKLAESIRRIRQDRKRQMFERGY